MMRKLLGSLSGVTAGALLSLCFMATSATAQSVDKDADRGDTVKIHVSGDMVLDMVYRSPGMTEFVGRTSNQPGNLVDGETTVEGTVAVTLAADLSDNVSAVISIGTKGVDNGNTTYYGDGTISPSGAPPASGSAAGGAEIIHLLEAHMRVNEFLMKELSAELGLTTWSFDVRGQGSPFAFGPRGSSSMTKNIFQGQFYGFADDHNSLGANQLDEMETMGGVFTYTRDALSIDVVLLPGVLDQGNATFDEALYAIDFLYNLDDKGSRFGAIVALSSLATDNAAAVFGNGIIAPPGVPGRSSSQAANLFTVGGGVTLHGMMEGLELYGEVYAQFGDILQMDANAVATGSESELEAGGMAFQLGANYTLPNNPNNIHFGANLTWVSGDDDDINTATNFDDEFGEFISYENVNDLMIIEDMYWGYDWDSNYMAIKIDGGISFSAFKQNDLELDAIIGFVNTVEDVIMGTGVGPTGSKEDGLGTEVDVKLTWHLNSQASIGAAVAFLFGSDILEESMIQRNGPNADDEDSAMLATLGFAVGF